MKHRPIILIPGIFGSILKNQHGEVLWPCASRLGMPRIPFNMLRLWGTSDSAGVFHSFSSDIIHAVPGLAGCSELIPGVKSFRCFYELITVLKAQGYTEGTDLFAFTYDFRHAPSYLTSLFKAFICALKL